MRIPMENQTIERTTQLNHANQLLGERLVEMNTPNGNRVEVANGPA